MVKDLKSRYNKLREIVIASKPSLKESIRQIYPDDNDIKIYEIKRANTKTK